MRSDNELLSEFESGRLPKSEWTHRAHVRVSYLYASTLDLATATERMKNRILAFNCPQPTPPEVDRGYHETITQAFMMLIRSALIQSGPHRSSEEFCEAHPELLSKHALQDYYTHDRLMTRKAKADFVPPDLQPLPADTPALTTDGARSPFQVVDELDDRQVVQLHNLMQQQWWGKKRTLEDVARMVQHTSLLIGLVETSSDTLIGFCRALTDFTFRATIYDVMVAKRLQGQKLGRRLVDMICNNNRMQSVSNICLACEPELYSFYELNGFRKYEGRAQWMIKIQRPE